MLYLPKLTRKSKRHLSDSRCMSQVVWAQRPAVSGNWSHFSASRCRSHANRLSVYLWRLFGRQWHWQWHQAETRSIVDCADAHTASWCSNAPAVDARQSSRWITIRTDRFAPRQLQTRPAVSAARRRQSIRAMWHFFCTTLDHLIFI